MKRHATVLIIDFGSQVTQLIARRVREFGCYSEVHPCTISEAMLEKIAPKAIILSGGPAGVCDYNAPTVTPKVFELGVPVLGICYGQQLMCHMLGGQVDPSQMREYGRASLTVKSDSPLFKDVWKEGKAYEVWMSHGDKVTKLPADFSVLAVTDHAPFAAVAHQSKPYYGVQFHPEVTHTPEGAALLNNFLKHIAKVEADWTMSSFMEEKLIDIKAQIGQDKVLCAVSGGVDSTVVATLLHRAIGNQLHCIFVDSGLLRKDEAKQVVGSFARLGIPLQAVDASELFLSRLEGVEDPEQKRKIIGKSFIDVFEEEAKKIEGVHFLAQGTLYPDVIESVSFHGGPSVTIKSHHNVGGLPERMQFKLVEPLRELFKDEVRRLGRELGIEDALLERHPFPGPGLAIRIPGAVTREKVTLLQEADAVYIQALRDAGLYQKIWQAFSVLLPVKTVGVMGDGRTYEYVLALRAVTSSDGMTADYYPFEHSFLAQVSNQITNAVKGINRIVYDITSKPPGTIEWE